jgi:hypothetical protein
VPKKPIRPRPPKCRECAKLRERIGNMTIQLDAMCRDLENDDLTFNGLTAMLDALSHALERERDAVREECREALADEAAAQKALASLKEYNAKLEAERDAADKALAGYVASWAHEIKISDALQTKIRQKLTKARSRKMMLSGADYDILDALDLLVTRTDEMGSLQNYAYIEEAELTFSGPIMAPEQKPTSAKGACKPKPWYKRSLRDLLAREASE